MFASGGIQSSSPVFISEECRVLETAVSDAVLSRDRTLIVFAATLEGCANIYYIRCTREEPNSYVSFVPINSDSNGAFCFIIRRQLLPSMTNSRSGCLKVRRLFSFD